MQSELLSFSLSPIAIIILLSSIATLVAFFIRIKASISAVSVVLNAKIEKEHADLRYEILSNFVTRSDFDTRIDRLEKGMDRIFDYMRKMETPPTP